MAGHPFANCNNLQTPVKEEEEILSIKFKERFLLLLTIRKRSAEGKPGGVQKIAKGWTGAGQNYLNTAMVR
jgi:hypothetical protein